MSTSDPKNDDLNKRLDELEVRLIEQEHRLLPIIRKLFEHGFDPVFLMKPLGRIIILDEFGRMRKVENTVEIIE
jgi:hypothetical protein